MCGREEVKGDGWGEDGGWEGVREDGWEEGERVRRAG